MRAAFLAFTMLAGFAIVPAMAQMQSEAPPPAGPFVGTVPPPSVAPIPAQPSRQPVSHHATNINQSNTRSVISPSLPPTGLGPNADATQNLQVAVTALRNGQTGRAQHALENAQTYLLNRSVIYDRVNHPSSNPTVQTIGSALNALGHGNRAQSLDLASQALSMSQQAGMPAGSMQGGMAPGPAAAPR